MCSGCSGDFEGDSDDREFGDSEPLDRETGWDEAFIPEAGVVRWGRPGGMNDAGDYEVLVSDERIVERRTIRAKYPAISYFGRAAAICTRTEAAWLTEEGWGGRLPESEQSLGTTAKYYRTYDNYDSPRPGERADSGKFLMWWYLAWLGALALTLWWAVG